MLISLSPYKEIRKSSRSVSPVAQWLFHLTETQEHSKIKRSNDRYGALNAKKQKTKKQLDYQSPIQRILTLLMLSVDFGHVHTARIWAHLKSFFTLSSALCVNVNAADLFWVGVVSQRVSVWLGRNGSLNKQTSINSILLRAWFLKLLTLIWNDSIACCCVTLKLDIKRQRL